MARDFDLGGTRVNRMGFGTMRLPGWPIGRRSDAEAAHTILRRAVELGVDHIDTAWFYRRDGASSNTFIREALHPYPEGLVLATKIGPRFAEDGHTPADPAHTLGELRRDLEANLTELGTDRIGLVNLRLGGIDGPFDGDAHEPFEALATLQSEGLIGALGLSNVTERVLDQALAIAPVATVQNSFNLADQSDAAFVDRCAEAGIGYVPFFPLGGHVNPDMLEQPGLVRFAEERGETPARIALAWLLHRAPNLLLIPGTSTPAHLEANVGAADIELTESEVDALRA
ncbi:aldo/keto reductase [Sciscionella sediminilitoris]|uniref:aldo/keto reductase n=1 Tax=Sciscionella sediminilitoris TaxID=1445613 RepID=UPI0004DEE67E|nr:aldo/keto reductase [Sciscionella sp. SE31]